MSEPADTEDQNHDGGLYLTDAQLIRRLGVPKKMGYAAIHELEKTAPDRPKFPAYDPLFPRRRFWPAVKKYFKLRHGLADHPFMVAPHWQESKNATEQAGKSGGNRDAGTGMEAARDTLEGLLAAAAGHRRERVSHKKPTLVASKERSDSDA